MPATARPLTAADIPAAISILTRAFADDPGLLFVLPDPADRARLNARLAAAALRYTLRCGAPLVTSDDVRVRLFGEVKPGFFGAEMVHPQLRVVRDNTPLPATLRRPNCGTRMTCVWPAAL